MSLYIYIFTKLKVGTFLNKSNLFKFYSKTFNIGGIATQFIINLLIVKLTLEIQ